MATIIFTAVGTLIGGPIGGAIGSLIGQQVDQAIFAPDPAYGPRLKEVDVQTSSYGRSIPAVFGKMRVSGSVIWATDLIERTKKSGGGKGKPKIVSYDYSVNFAVALSSRTALRIERIWADGKLIRSSAQASLSSGGMVRFYSGAPGQKPDPLIVTHEGQGAAPAYRGLAYVVFENLPLADFGNRIPSLTFELVADEAAVNVSDVTKYFAPDIQFQGATWPLIGYVAEGRTLSDNIAALLPVDQLLLRSHNGQFQLAGPDHLSELELPDEVAVSINGQLISDASSLAIEGASSAPHVALRYYDVARDYQISAQAAGQDVGRDNAINVDLPAVLSADSAAYIVSKLQAARAASAFRKEVCICEDDAPALAIGQPVSFSGQRGRYVIQELERLDGVLRLVCAPQPAQFLPIQSGASAPHSASSAQDIGPTFADIFDVPYNGLLPDGQAGLLVVAGGQAGGWRGANVSVLSQGAYQEEGSISSGATIAALLEPLPASSALVWDRRSRLVLSVASGAVSFSDADDAALLNGANLIHVGGEFLQFTHAKRLDEKIWALSGLQRGLFGTESEAAEVKPIGALATLVEKNMPYVFVDTANRTSGALVNVAIEGLGDAAPIILSEIVRNKANRAPAPVHGRWQISGADLRLSWVRRSRNALPWQDFVDAPQMETNLIFTVSQVNAAGDLLRFWQVNEATIALPLQNIVTAQSASGLSFEIRQLGGFGASDPLRIHVS